MIIKQMKFYLSNNTNGLISINFIIDRIHYIKEVDKFFKFIIHIDNFLKLLVLLLPCEQSDLSIRTLRLVHIVPRQSHTNLPVCSVHYVNYLVSHFELFIPVFGHCRYQHWGQIFLFSKVSCCIDQLIPQSQKLVEICLSYCTFLDQSELFVVIFLEYIEFYIQVVGIVFGPREMSKSVLTSAPKST